RASLLYWKSDAKRSERLMNQAMESAAKALSEVANANDRSEEDIQSVIALRRQILQEATPKFPELVIAFVRMTRSLTNSDNGQGPSQEDLKAELSAASYLVRGNPRRAYQIATDVLHEGMSPSLLDLVYQLRGASPDLAISLSHE